MIDNGNCVEMRSLNPLVQTLTEGTGDGTCLFGQVATSPLRACHVQCGTSAYTDDTFGA